MRESRWLGAALALLVMLLAGSLARSQGVQNTPVVVQWLPHRGYAVRLVYVAPIAYTWLPMPLILKKAGPSGPVAGTWSNEYWVGVTEWISPGEIRAFAVGLQKLGLKWDISRKPMVFHKEPFVPPPPPAHLDLPWALPRQRHKGAMEIDVTCDVGSAVADLPAAGICGSMKQLQGLFHEHTAVDAFRDSREDWGCGASSFRYYKAGPFKAPPGK